MTQYSHNYYHVRWNEWLWRIWWHEQLRQQLWRRIKQLWKWIWQWIRKQLRRFGLIRQSIWYFSFNAGAAAATKVEGEK